MSMNYEDMSDYEINLSVAKTCKMDIYPLQGASMKAYPDSVLVHTKTGTVESDEINFLRSPSDAWPIIVENKIMMNPAPELDDWEWRCRTIHTPIVRHKNPLRAAMIVYLMMQEQADEQ